MSHLQALSTIPEPSGNPSSFVYGIVDVCPVPLQIRIHRRHGVPRGVGHPLHVQGLDQVAQDPVGMAIPQAVPCPREPPPCLGGASIGAEAAALFQRFCAAW